MITLKDRINKISGLTLIALVSILIIVSVFKIELHNGFSLLNLFYIAGPIFLVWFGTRKNGCGSCNQQSCSDSSSELKSHEEDTPNK